MNLQAPVPKQLNCGAGAVRVCKTYERRAMVLNPSLQRFPGTVLTASLFYPFDFRGHRAMSGSGLLMRGTFASGTRVLFGVVAGMFSLSQLGCGGGASGPELHAVSGQVQFDGKPIEKGRIVFRLEAGDQKSYSAEIVNGAYALESEAGNASVEITATRGTGKFDDQGGAAEPVPIEEMYIPKQYNSETTLKKEVAAGANDFSFDLKSN